MYQVARSEAQSTQDKVGGGRALRVISLWSGREQLENMWVFESCTNKILRVIRPLGRAS